LPSRKATRGILPLSHDSQISGTEETNSNLKALRLRCCVSSRG
jgi:hypothetical protein